MSDAVRSHRRESREDDGAQEVVCAVLTVSDTRTVETDTSGARAVALLEADGHVIHERVIVRDEPAEIAARLDGWTHAADVRAVIMTGGTGMARRDRTIEVVRGRLTAELDGFGELFRFLSYEEIGSAAMLSRAVAGLVVTDGAGGDTFVFALPGSTHAVETAMTRLIIPELRHLVWGRR